MQKRRIVLALIVLTLVLSSFFIGKTFAKYITTVEGSGIARIAKWSFKANGQTTSISQISLVDTVDESKLLEGKIAPGTSGSFDILIDATGSDVGVDYKVEFEGETSKPTNLKFQVGTLTVGTLEELESVLTGTIAANDEEKTRTLTVNWIWPYETGTGDAIATNDLVDKQNANDITQYTFNVSITGTQVNPKA